MEGSIGSSLTSLDEPVSITLLRDLRAIGFKLKYVLLPKSTSDDAELRELRNWDLWGPLLLCLLLSVVLSASAPSGQASLVFAAVFVVVWGGAAVVTLNSLLLGAKVGFFQSVCVLGYCMFPLVLAAVPCYFVSYAPIKFILVAVGFGWATKASAVFSAALVDESKKALSVYPVVLFYVALAWMIFLS